MNKKFEINRTKIKGDCQSGRKVVTHNSKSDLALANQAYLPTCLTKKASASATSISLLDLKAPSSATTYCL